MSPMKANGYKVENTHGEDLDEDQTGLINSNAEVMHGNIGTSAFPLPCFKA